MLRLAILMLGITMASSCTFFAPPNAKTVDEVLANLEALDDSEMVIEGWLGECFGYDCGLYQSRQDAKIVDRGNHESEAWSLAMDRRLNLCVSDELKLLADSTARYERVVVSGQLDATCRLGARKGTFFCFDGCDFETKSIERIILQD